MSKAMVQDLVLVGITITLAALAVNGGRRAIGSQPGIDATGLIGRQLPRFTLPDLDGNQVVLGSARKPKVLIVVNETDCLSCGDFPLEARILRNDFPDLPVIFVGTGADTAFFRSYFKQQRTPVLLDVEQKLLSSLRFNTTPLVALLDVDNRILAIDARPPQLTKAWPLSAWISALAGLQLP